MKRKIWLLCLISLLVNLFMVMTALAQTDIEEHRDCRHCGMDRKAFGYSRMLVEYKDGKSVGTCSLHCVVTELRGKKSDDVLAIKVADRDSRKLIDADKAVWVIGGSKRGVMTARAKWAFTTKEAARKFIAAFGGSISTWDDALAAAKEDALPKAR